MAEVTEYAARLSQAIGPRPAGTEEEQQASFAIEEILQQEAALDVRSEEFSCNPNYELPRIICCVITVVLGLLSLFLPLMIVPSFVVCLVAAAIYALSIFGISPLARISKSGVSQNIIGKYIPAQNGEQSPVTRRRKVLVVAHYDTGRVRRGLGATLSIVNIIHWVELGAMVLVPLSLLIRAFLPVEGGATMFFTVITAIGMVGALLPVIAYAARQTAPYNEGANCNAAGVAVMLEVAKRVGLGLYDQDEEEDVVMHGEAAAREAGVLPEGAQVEYAEDVPATAASPESTSAMAPLDLSAEIAASQAVRAAAPVEDTISVARDEVAEAAPHAAAGEAPQAAATPAAAQMAAAPAPAPVAQKPDNVPEWFKRAQAKANRASSDSTPAQRSRFADAIDGATAARQAEAARAAEERTSAMDARLAEVHASIMNSPNAAEAHSAAKAASAQQTGVDGFLASTTEAPDYETASAVDPDAPATTETKQAGEVADRLLSADLDALPKGEGKPAAPAAEKKAAPAAAAPAAAAATAAGQQQQAHASAQEPAQKASPRAKKAAAKPAEKAEPRRKRAITLPSLTGAIEAVNSRSLSLEEEEEPEPRVPVIKEKSAPAPTARTARERQSFSSSIPALSDDRFDEADDEEEASEVVSVAGSFSVGGATGAFAPVGDELLADVDPDDVYVDDADDSDYDEGFTATGALTSPSQVQMPTHRGVLGRFRRKKKDDEVSFAAAIGVDADFDARKVGRERGGWESFRKDSVDFDDSWDDDDDWNGGAFSRDRLQALASKVKPGERSEGRRGRGGDADDAPRTRFAGTDLDESEERGDASGSRRNLHPFDDVPLQGLGGEDREAIREFHGGPINMEIWFVALGAELADNAGMRALISEHAAELRGSMVIVLDGLGAGELSMIEREGMYRPARMSSRMKRYVHKAASSLGLSVGKGQMLWCDTAAYLAARQKYQTLHLAGMQNGKPAYCGQADDVFDNLDEITLQDNADFVMELIRAI